MKSLQQHISEKLIVNKKYDSYKYHPKTPEELRKIIKERYEELGPGTKNEPIDFNDIDVSQMITFYDTKNQVGIFEKTKFEYIDISDWNVSNVIDMNSTFWGCQLKELDLSNWNVSNVIIMTSMFDGSRSLKKLEISNWDILNTKYMSYMFHYCKSLKELDLSNWDISNVENMFRMFAGCKKEIIPDWYKE